MQPDDFIGDAFSDLDEDGFDYDDGFEPDLIDDEADYVSASKRRVKTKGEAVRSRTPGVLRAVNRSKHRNSRREQKRAIRQMFMRKANALWTRKVRIAIRKRLPWVTEALLALMMNKFFMRANALITAKMTDATSLTDLGKISVKSMIAAALTAAAERDGRITPAQAHDHALKIYDGLSMVEKFIESRGDGCWQLRG